MWTLTRNVVITLGEFPISRNGTVSVPIPAEEKCYENVGDAVVMYLVGNLAQHLPSSEVVSNSASLILLSKNPK